MTVAASAHTIGYVLAQSDSQSQARHQDLGLTKRRAVDFCRVATAICPA
jgi:hypothetical protein